MSEVFVNIHKVEFFSAFLIAVAVYWVGSIASSDDVTTLRYRRRAGIGAFVLYAVFAFLQFHPRQSEQVFSILVRGILVAGVVSGTLGLCLPILFWIWGIIARPWRAFHTWRAFGQQRQSARRKANEELRQQKWANAEWERTRPARERAAAEAMALQKEEERLKAHAQKRRDDARARCEILYARHAPEIAGRFTRSMFTDFVQRYMGDNYSPDAVEERGQQLCELIEQHCQATKPQAKVHTIDELARWFLAEKQRIETLELDEEMKDEHLAHLQMRYSELSQEILEKVRP